jgi:hypothetical protein
MNKFEYLERIVKNGTAVFINKKNTEKLYTSIVEALEDADISIPITEIETGCNEGYDQFACEDCSELFYTQYDAQLYWANHFLTQDKFHEHFKLGLILTDKDSMELNDSLINYTDKLQYFQKFLNDSTLFLIDKEEVEENCYTDLHEAFRELEIEMPISTDESLGSDEYEQFVCGVCNERFDTKYDAECHWIRQHLTWNEFNERFSLCVVLSDGYAKELLDVVVFC